MIGAHGILKGKRGLILGVFNETSIAFHVAERALAEGAELILSNSPLAMRMGTVKPFENHRSFSYLIS